MSRLWTIFSIFFNLSFFSFGGGYVMLPMIDQKLQAAGIILDKAELTNITAIAGMAPGPVAVNAAVGFGYYLAGFAGVFSAFLGVAIPCASIVIVVAKFFFKVYKHRLVQDALYGLRPVTVAVVAYTAVDMIIRNHMIAAPNIVEWRSVIILIISYLLLDKTKVHPLLIILGSGILGTIIF